MNSLADRRSRLAPVFTREVFGNENDRPSFVDIGPRDVAPDKQRIAHCSEHSGRYELESAERRYAPFGLMPVFGEDRIIIGFTSHRDRVRKADGSDAGN